MQLQIVNLSTNEELPYWIEQLCTPILWTKVTVDAKDTIFLQVTKSDSYDPNPNQVFEYFSCDTNKILEDKPVMEINDKTMGFNVVARVKVNMNTHYVLGTYELKSNFDYCNICGKDGYLAFCYTTWVPRLNIPTSVDTESFKHYSKETSVIAPKDGLYKITITEFDDVERIAFVEDLNGIVCARYCESEMEPQYGKWQIRVGENLNMQYLYVTDINEFQLGVKHIGEGYVKVVNTDSSQITTQIRIPIAEIYPNKMLDNQLRHFSGSVVMCGE